MSFNVRTRLSKLKSSAKARGIKLNLDINKYQNLIDIGCVYCGNDLTNENGYCLDRVDSNLGYNLTNVVPCCKLCNMAKGSMKIDDFVKWVKKVNAHILKVEEMLLKDESGIGEYTVEKEIKFHNELNNNRADYIKLK